MSNYSNFVQSRLKPGEDILSELTPAKCEFLHMAFCIMEEAGEVGGAIKKHLFYDKPLDLEKIVKELGDLEFYLQGLRNCLELDRGDILEANVTKLTARYPEGKFSNKAAVERVDTLEAIGIMPEVPPMPSVGSAPTAKAGGPAPYPYSTLKSVNLSSAYTTKDSSVFIDKLHPAMQLANQIAAALWLENGEMLVITSGHEALANHKPDSKHYTHEACDYRTRYFWENQKCTVGIELRSRLGVDFDVVVEADHIHCEYDPK